MVLIGAVSRDPGQFPQPSVERFRDRMAGIKIAEIEHGLSGFRRLHLEYVPIS